MQGNHIDRMTYMFKGEERMHQQSRSETLARRACSRVEDGFGVVRSRLGDLFVLVGTLSVLVATLVLSVPSASAKVNHPYLGSFNGEQTPAGSFAAPRGVAVDNSSSASAGDVYVSDTFHHVVDKFSAGGATYESQLTGTPSGSFGSVAAQNAVDGSGDLFVADTTKDMVDEFGPEGTFQKAFSVPQRVWGVATDASGDVFLAEGPSGVQEYNPATETLSTFATGTGSAAFGYAHGVAVNPSNGDVYVADQGDDVVDVFSSTGTYQSQLTGTSGGSFPAVSQVAVDPGNGHVFVVGEHSFAEFGPSGSFISEATMPNGGYAYSIAVDGKTGEIYVADLANSVVYMFGTASVPNVSTSPASGLSPNGVTLNGEIEPDSGEAATSCQFEYVAASEYDPSASNPYSAGKSVACEPSTPYSSSTQVAAHINGLSQDTLYHFRLAAADKGGTNYSADATFETVGAPSSTYQSVVAGPSSAIVHASVNPHGATTRCYVQYVDAAAYQASAYAGAPVAPCEPAQIPAGAARDVQAQITGLRADATYRFRVVVANSYGEEAGGDHAFLTFGISDFAASLLGSELGVFSQAGGHPYQLTTRISLNTNETGNGDAVVTGNAQTIHVQLPPGLIGNPTATERCPRTQVEELLCSGAAQIGTIAVRLIGGPEKGESVEQRPIYNIVPPRGAAAEFGGFINGQVTAMMLAHVRTGDDYGVSIDSLDITTLKHITGVTVTMWGVPADSSHDAERRCGGALGCAAGVAPKPFLTAPTSCTGSMQATALVDSYQAPAQYVSKTATLPAMTGCEKVPFKPSISVTPESHSSDSPTGLEVDLKVPQEENPQGIASADLKDATVVLPAGVTLNPSSTGGMVGCPLLNGKESHAGQTGIDLENGEPARCPNESKIGSVTIETPLLEHSLTGGVYVAQQGDAGAVHGSNPFGSLLALYVAAENAERGVVIKLAGKVNVDPQTGQLTTTFDENPQLPFEDLKLRFFGGQRAALVTPHACGTFTTTSSLTPWSSPESGPPATPSSAFTIGSGCTSGFSPSFAAGTMSNAAGSFSPFTLTLTREDGEQTLSTLSTTLPPGLAGEIANVTPCGEPQASAGQCPAASQIGHVVVQAGVGREPITLPEAGKPQDPVYLTGPYDGAPFGLSIVVPAETGPFNLGTVVVRAAIHVDPHTARASIVSAPMPTMLRGIPLDVKRIDVIVDRSQFMFNPTSCDATAITGTAGSAQGASTALSSRFQAAECRSLAFRPGFSALTNASHSKINGESLHVIVTSGAGQANIKSVHVDIPKQLPARLPTLNHACSEAQFAANPAGCPSGAIVGTATAYTPVLPVPLSGPAMFVSHGGAGFPDLDLVLQGDGVTLVLTGNTFISKSGVTSSTFASVPDVPIARFDLLLPQGRGSALSATGNLCAKPLVMPTTIGGQNGAVVRRNTKIGVSGCKPQLHVLRHKVKGATAVVVVRVPSAGRLLARGTGLSSATATLHEAGVARLDLRLSAREHRLLARHRGRKLRVVVRLLFKPAHGASLTASLTALMR